LGAVELLKSAPGKLFRALDRLLRTALTQEERDAVVAAAELVVPEVSGRVVLSVREHLHNRARETGELRVFVNRRGRAWVTDDERSAVGPVERERLVGALDDETRRRLPSPERLLVDPEVLDVALPLSGKATAAGLGVLPRGSLSMIEGELLRFFVYWKESAQRTDFDLSALMLNADYSTNTWLSYTSLTEVEGEHSGDIVEAPDGASEFINLRLGAVRGAFVVPQVNIFAGEGFEEVEESFFGFMLREGEQRGRPFEPRTVRMKSELRGAGRVALPLVFLRGDDGGWRAKWLHLYLKGSPSANRVEENRVTVANLLRGIVEREQLTVRHLVELMSGEGTTVTLWDGEGVPEGGPVTYIGLRRPDELPAGSRVVTSENLRDLIPA
jgi:stress response protein SCP2